MKIMLANFSKMIGDTGGAAKVFSAFANEMIRRGHKVVAVYSDSREGDFFYPVEEKVIRCNLQRYQNKPFLMPKRLKIKREFLRAIDVRKGRAVNDEFHRKFLLGNLREIVEKSSPDVIVSFHPMASMLFLCDLKTKIPVITMSHGDPEDYWHTYPKEELPAVELSAANQVLLPSFAAKLEKHCPHTRVEVIGNVVPEYEEPVDLSLPKENYKIIFIGRLVKNHKRPHLLIEAFRQIAEGFPNWQVEIWGATDKKSYLQGMQNSIEKSNLTKRIRFMGTTKDVAAVLKTGDIFAFPSAFEGWGMSLTEAMSMGLPAVGYKDTVAVNELIADGVTGLLAEEGAAGLAAALSKLMADKDLRIRLGKTARASMGDYRGEVIWDKWERLLREIGLC